MNKRGNLHPLSIFRHSSKLSATNIVGYILSLPASIYIARILGPESYGVFGFVFLWTFYANLIRPGFTTAASREMPNLIGMGEHDKALHIQNVAITFETIYYLLPITIILISSFFFENNVIKVGLILAAISYSLTIFDISYGNLQWVFQRFGIVTRIKIIQTFGALFFNVLLVTIMGVYGLFLSPIIISLCLLLFYFFATPKLSFRPVFDKSSAISLIKIGIILQALTFFSWTFRTFDRTLVAMWFSLSSLGFYVFALNLQLKLSEFVADFGRVLQPIIWHEFGKAKEIASTRDDIIRIMLVIFLFSAALTNLTQATFGPLVHLFIPKFIPSIKVFEYLSFDLFFGAAAILPSLILNSTLVNKQKITASIYASGLVLTVILAYFYSKILHFGLPGIALGFLTAQIIVTIILYKLSLKYVLSNIREQIALYLMSLVFVAVMLVGYLLLQGPLTFGQGTALPVIAYRLSVITLLWSIFGIIILLMQKNKFFFKSNFVEV